VSEKVELVRRSYEAWNSGDLRAFTEFLSPDVEIDLTERVFNPGSYQGIEDFRRWATELSEVWEDWKMEPEQIVEQGDQVLAVVRARGIGKGSGVEIEQVGYNVMTVRDGQATRIAFYYDRDKALSAAGLREAELSG
jgi:ketosteroid isomerase-like protein